MSQKYDPYAPCICGSGDKAKFCCADLIPRLHEVSTSLSKGNVAHAESILSELEQKSDVKLSTQNFMRILRVQSLLGDLTSVPRAQQILNAVLASDPKHPVALAMRATLHVMSPPFDVPLDLDIVEGGLDAAFRSQQVRHTVVAADEGIARRFLTSGKLALAVRYRYLFDILQSETEFSATDILRSRHFPLYVEAQQVLVNVDVAPALKNRLNSAMDLANRGQHLAALQEVEELVAAEPGKAGHRLNLGLARMWSGDSAGAAVAFREAVARETNFENQVDAETLAQTIEFTDLSPRLVALVEELDVTSVSTALSRLDESPQFMRDRNGSQAWLIFSEPAAEFKQNPDRATVFPNLLGLCLVRSTGGGEPQLAVEGNSVDLVQAAMKIVKDCLGDLLTGSKSIPVPTNMPADLGQFAPMSLLPALKTTASVNRYARFCEAELYRDRLPSVKIRALGNRTIAEAAKDPAARIAVAATLNILSSMLDNLQRESLYRNALRARFELPPVEFIPARSGDGISVLEALRLDPTTLRDDELEGTTEFFMGTSCLESQIRFGEEVLRRESLSQHHPIVSLALAAQVGSSEGLERATPYLDKARACFSSITNPTEKFQSEMRLALAEMQARAIHPDDPELPRLALRLWNHYCAKLNIQDQARSRFLLLGIPGPWDQQSIVASSAEEAGGLWTPDSAAEAAAPSESKLWVPGS